MVDGNGGKQKRFHIKDLPENIQAAYVSSLEIPLEALQSELKPPLKAVVKVNIGSYKGRLKEEKPIKNFDTQCTEVEREVAFNRQKIINAYSDADVSVKRFVEFYNDNLILPEIKDPPGNCDGLVYHALLAPGKVTADALRADQGIGGYSENKASYRKPESRAACIMRRLALTRFFSIFMFLSRCNASFLSIFKLSTPFLLLTRHPSSRNTTSSIQCSCFSIDQCPRMYFKHPSAEQSPLQM
jgi:hypothetical protein